MSQIRIPPEHRECVETYAIRPWVKDRNFACDAYFEAIDSFGEQIRKVTSQDGEVENKFLIPMIAAMVDSQESLCDYILKNTSEVGGAEKWYAVYTAAAWVILQTYKLAVEKGEWSGSE